MALAVVVGLLLVIEHLESVLWVRLIVDHLVLAAGVHERVPALDVAVAVGNLMALLGILVVARGEAELVALRPVQALDIMQVESNQAAMMETRARMRELFSRRG